MCSINIGGDQTICQGSSATLQGPTGYGNMIWSTGETTQSISVNTAGDYWCQVSYPSGNLVTNGDFSAGNTGFSSQFTYSLFSVQNEGMYTVGPNASWYHPQFQGTGNGNFLIANAGYGSWSNGQTDVWCQTIPACPGQTYTLGFRAKTLSNELPARAVWLMDGALVNWPDFTFPAYSAGWQQFTTTWTAGPGQTSVNACIHLTSGDGVGDDLGIDDINISGTIVLRDTVHVYVTPLPQVDLGPDTSLCAGEVMDLDASYPGGTYIWQDGSTAPTLQVSSGGNYSVTVTAQNCGNTDQINIAYLSMPVVDLGPDTMVCTGSTLALSAAGPGYSYLWQDGSLNPSFTVTGPGLYWAEVGNGTCTTRDSITVGYKPRPSVQLGNDTTICAGETINLDASWPGASYLWQDGSLSPILNASTAGSFHVTVNLNGCSVQDTIQVAVMPLPSVDIGNDTTVCPGEPVSFNATVPGGSYLWNDGSTLPLLAASTPGTYAVQVTANGCVAADTCIISNFSLQSVNLGSDRTICAGSSTRIGVSVPGAFYTWNTGASADSITVFSSGTYWVEASLNGCTVRDSINLAVSPLPVFSLGPDVEVCPGAQVLLNANTAGAGYSWSNGSISPTITTGAGTWSVMVTVGNCSSIDTIVITESQPPTVTLGPDTTLCPGSSITLSAGTPLNTVAWSTGATSQSITVASPGTVSVTTTDSMGCTASDAIVVSYANPGSLYLGPDTTLCAGETIALNATLPNASQYHWSTGSFNPVLAVGSAGLFWAEVTVGACTVTDTISVAVAQAPVAFIGNDTTLCPGAVLQLLAPVTPGQAVWQDGSSGNNFTVTATGNYWLALTNAAGCSDTAFIHVNYLDAGTLNLGPDTSLCAGSSTLLDAGLPGGYTVWSGAVTATSPTVQANLAGTYIATTTIAGCSMTDSISISTIPLPVVDLGPDDQFCAGSSFQLLAAGTSLLWDDGSTAPSRTIYQGGTYWVRSTENGCTASDTIVLAEIPLPLVNLGPDTAICAYAHVAVNTAVPGGSYLWNDGGTSALRTLGPGMWSVFVTSAGCTAGDSLLITDIPAPIINLPADTTLCNGASWSLNVSQPGCSYLWSNGSTAPALLVTGPGTYGISVDRSGCTSTGQTQVSVVDLSNFTLGADTTICPGTGLLLDVGMPGATVLWEDGSTAPQRIINSEGNYHAAISLDGCTADASLQVGVTPIPLVDLGPDRTQCAGDTIRLSVDPGPASLVWTTGGTDVQLEVNSSGTYGATLTLDGCTSTDQATFTFLPPVSSIELGPDQAICPGGSITLDATLPGANYLWSTGSTVATLVVDKPGIFSVAVEGMCIQAADTIVISEGQCKPTVYIPNAFTPDGDGINDLFIPMVDGPIGSWDFRVFNRWGQCIFTSSTPNGAWDGTFQAMESPVGVYAWTLHYTSVTDEGVIQVRRTGSVSLVR
ncbi:MAG: gliding motility-associated C-terminal domain-containing protein [Bacteroidetes bacterium]|nr:gliding motility-associated C-terminal domain-containing protein [Bacteroidota bacterium]